MQVIITIIVALLVCVSPLCHADGIQKWVDGNGRIHYGERPSSINDAVSVTNAVSVVDVDATQSAVVLYSTRQCGYCKKAKAFMDARQIRYREYDIENNDVAYAQYKRLGGRGVPFLVRQGRVMYGFSETHYKRFFGL